MHSLTLRALVAGLFAAVCALALQPATPAAAANTYPYGQCTYYAKSVRTDVGNQWGNARYWAAQARAAGFPVGSTPRIGDVVVFGPHVQHVSGYGHVGIVAAIRGTRFQVVSMWGGEATGRIHVNWYHTGAGVQFIHRRR